jgi:hypothetical protein
VVEAVGTLAGEMATKALEAESALAECRAKVIEECKEAMKPWLVSQGLHFTLQELTETFDGLAP